MAPTSMKSELPGTLKGLHLPRIQQMTDRELGEFIDKTKKSAPILGPHVKMFKAILKPYEDELERRKHPPLLLKEAVIVASTASSLVAEQLDPLLADAQHFNCVRNYTDSALVNEINRVRENVLKLGARLPDRGNKLEVTLNHLEIELKRRKNAQLRKDAEVASVKVEYWRGHSVAVGNVELLSAIALDHPETFHDLGYQSEFMWSVGLNALCQLVKEFIVKSARDLTTDDVNSFRIQITDVESSLCFKLNWMHIQLKFVELRCIHRPLLQQLNDINNRKALLSKQLEGLQNEFRNLEEQLESLELDRMAKISEIEVKANLSAVQCFYDPNSQLLKEFVGKGVLPSYQMGVDDIGWDGSMMVDLSERGSGHLSKRSKKSSSYCACSNHQRHPTSTIDTAPQGITLGISSTRIYRKK